jgi:hypothetical protein
VHLLFVLYFLLFPFFLGALPVGNASSPLLPEEGLFISKEAFMTVEMEWQGDWILRRPLKLEHRYTKTLRNKFTDFNMSTESGRLTLNLLDRAELHGQLGTSSFSLSQLPNSSTLMRYETKSSFSWGLFGNVLIAFWGNLDLSLAAGYMRCNADMDYVSVSGVSQHPPSGSIHMNEWNAALSFSYKMSFLTPYIGANYSQARYKFENMNELPFLSANNSFRVTNRIPIALAFGCSLQPYRGFAVNLEMRVLDETAYTLNVKMRF